MVPDINLLPETKKRKGTWLLTAGSLFLLFLLGYGGITILANYESEKAAELKMEREEMIQVMEERKTSDQDLNAYQDATKEVEQRLPSVSLLLEKVTSHMPEDSVISGFDYTSPTQLKMSLRLLDMKEAAYFLDALQKEQSFPFVTLSSLNQTEALSEEEAEQPVYRYEANYEITINPKVDLFGDRNVD